MPHDVQILPVASKSKSLSICNGHALQLLRSVETQEVFGSNMNWNLCVEQIGKIDTLKILISNIKIFLLQKLAQMLN